MFRQPVVIATEAEDEVAGLPDVDAVSDVLEQEGEAFSSGQRRHVALRQRQVSGGAEKTNGVTSFLKRTTTPPTPTTTRTSRTETAPPAER